MNLGPAIVGIAFAASSGMAQGAAFADPTKPPGMIAAGEESGAAPAGPRLESVLIAPDRRIAVISGQQYRTGDKFGDGRIERISASEVAIRTGESMEVLKLIPGIEKRTRPRSTRGAR